jgi:hypothetical protein
MKQPDPGTISKAARDEAASSKAKTPDRPGLRNKEGQSLFFARGNRLEGQAGTLVTGTYPSHAGPDGGAVRRAGHSGLLATLGREQWPAALSAADDGTDGSCHLRHLRRRFRLSWPAEEEP